MGNSAKEQEETFLMFMQLVQNPNFFLYQGVQIRDTQPLT